MGRLPIQAKGMLVKCVVCDFWYPERDFRIKKQEGKWKCKWCYETLTDKERNEQLQRRLR